MQKLTHLWKKDIQDFNCHMSLFTTYWGTSATIFQIVFPSCFSNSCKLPNLSPNLFLLVAVLFSQTQTFAVMSSWSNSKPRDRSRSPSQWHRSSPGTNWSDNTQGRSWNSHNSQNHYHDSQNYQDSQGWNEKWTLQSIQQVQVCLCTSPGVGNLMIPGSHHSTIIPAFHHISKQMIVTLISL